MRRLGLLVFLVACHSKPAPTIALAVVQPPRPSNPDATIVAVVPTSCTDLAPPEQQFEQPCKPQVLSTTVGGALTAVLDTAGCSRGQNRATAGSTQFELLVRLDGTMILGSGDRSACEKPPLPFAQPAIVGSSDGHLAYWGKDESGGFHFVIRTPDAKWRVSPAIRTDANIGLGLYEQNGRIAGAFQSTIGGEGSEFGYFDEPTNQLRPIRRGTPGSGLILVPGAAADEPPTAMYSDDRTTVIDQPDAESGYRRLAITLTSQTCPHSERFDPDDKPSGNFVFQDNSVLFRTAGGGLWLAYTEAKGHCVYRVAENRRAGTRDPFLFAHQPPPPPEWVSTAVVDQANLVLVPVERGAFGDARRARLPAIRPSYTGPQQFHPSVSSKRVQIAVGDYLFELDPTKLANSEPLVHAWISAPVVAPSAVTFIVTPPPKNAPPLEDLRLGELAKPLTVTAKPERRIADFGVTQRTASDVALVDRQVVFHTGTARALAMAATPEAVAFTLFSQQGIGPLVEIDPREGSVRTTPSNATISAGATIIRYDHGKVVFGNRLPANAPPVPPGWMIYDNDATSIFATSYDRGYELLRGTVDRAANPPAWKWDPAFRGGRTPPTKAPLGWPVFLHHASGDPTLVYVEEDGSKRVTLHVRTPDGTHTDIPTWRGEMPGTYRVHELAAVEIPSATLPIVAAKVDWSIALAYPAKTGYVTRVIAGNEAFTDLPPPNSDPKCSEVVNEREREEVYSPQLFAWDPGAGVAYLSTRVRERLRWTSVAPMCGWVVDRRTVANELAVARVDAKGITEVVRVPVEYRGGTGFHGSTLLIDREGKNLHAIATSYGIATYTRVLLPKLDR